MDSPKRKYGWKRDPKYSELKKKKHRLFYGTLPSKVDLRSACPPVYDQGELGSCTANALAAAYQIVSFVKKSVHMFCPSRLFIYYNERVLENAVDDGCGALITSGIKVMKEIGICPETDDPAAWEYVVDNFNKKPKIECYNFAEKNKIISAQPITQRLDQIKQTLMKRLPIVFGFSVFESFEKDVVTKTGIVSLPSDGEQELGGHAVIIVGYDNDNEWFIVRNSWGDTWGDKGYFYMPYEYILNPILSDEFWAITKI